jgi:hypothetical protein
MTDQRPKIAALLADAFQEEEYFFPRSPSTRLATRSRWCPQARSRWRFTVISRGPAYWMDVDRTISGQPSVPHLRRRRFDLVRHHLDPLLRRHAAGTPKRKLENGHQRLAPENRRSRARDREYWRQRLEAFSLNPGKSRRFSHTWKPRRRDRTGWLG